MTAEKKPVNKCIKCFKPLTASQIRGRINYVSLRTRGGGEIPSGPFCSSACRAAVVSAAKSKAFSEAIIARGTI